MSAMTTRSGSRTCVGTGIAEIERLEKLAKDKKYQDWLASLGWSKEKAGEFYVNVNGNVYSLYKKIGELTL